MNFINENHHVDENVMHDEKDHMDDIQQDGWNYHHLNMDVCWPCLVRQGYCVKNHYRV
jgi:hypothetical protein